MTHHLVTLLPVFAGIRRGMWPARRHSYHLLASTPPPPSTCTNWEPGRYTAIRQQGTSTGTCLSRIGLSPHHLHSVVPNGRDLESMEYPAVPGQVPPAAAAGATRWRKSQYQTGSIFVPVDSADPGKWEASCDTLVVVPFWDPVQAPRRSPLLGGGTRRYLLVLARSD